MPAIALGNLPQKELAGRHLLTLQSMLITTTAVVTSR
jgi:hypothetical protein